MILPRYIRTLFALILWICNLYESTRTKNFLWRLYYKIGDHLYTGGFGSRYVYSVLACYRYERRALKIYVVKNGYFQSLVIKIDPFTRLMNQSCCVLINFFVKESSLFVEKTQKMKNHPNWIKFREHLPTFRVTTLRIWKLDDI